MKKSAKKKKKTQKNISRLAKIRELKILLRNSESESSKLVMFLSLFFLWFGPNNTDQYIFRRAIPDKYLFSGHQGIKQILKK